MTPDLLDRLADVETPAPTVRLAAVERRARHLRQARRARRVVVGTAGLATVLVLGGVVVPQLSDQDRGSGAPAVALALGVAPARAADATTRCGTGFAELVERADWAAEPSVPEAAALLDDPAWPITSIGVRRVTTDCLPAVPAAVLVDADPARGITLWSDVATPFSSDLDGVVDVAVRGATGQLRDVGTAAYVTWLDADGVRWMANGSGMTPDELVADIDGLVLDGTAVDPASVPDGFDPGPVPDPPTSTTGRSWSVTYGDTESHDADGDGAYKPSPGAGVDLEVTSEYRDPVQVAVSYWSEQVRLVDLDGVVGEFSPMGDPAVDVGGWLIWQRDGLTYTLSGALPMEQLVDLARTVQPVALDDPRIDAAPDWPSD